MSLIELQRKLQERRGEQRKTKENLKKSQERLGKTTLKIQQNEEAREILRYAGQKTQETLAFHISDITSLALTSVFGDNAYKLVVDFVQRRNKTECDLWFERDGKRINPIDASGLGAVDVVSFALRVASWTMSRPKTRPVIILDEPMRFLSRDLQNKASEMIKEISEKLGIQFIIITHETEITESADKVFTVRKPSGQPSVVTEN